MTTFAETITKAILASIMLFIVALIDKKHRQQTNFIAGRGLSYGLFLLISATLLNSLETGRWSSDDVYDFLTLENVGRWLFRVIAAGSYFLILGGCAGLIAAIVGKLQDRKREKI